MQQAADAEETQREERPGVLAHYLTQPGEAGERDHRLSP